MNTTIQRSNYIETIGVWGNREAGFAHPVAVAVNETTGWTYVLNRSTAWHAPHGRAVRVVIVGEDHAYLGEFGKLGMEPGQLFMPTAIALDGAARVFVSDEHTNSVSVFSETGEFITRWGKEGQAPGDLCRLSGLAFDLDGSLLVVDHGNHRIQRFTTEGEFLGSFGSLGSAPGELNLPWGICVDVTGRIWVADWGNNRVQAFSQEGACVLVLGDPAGAGDGFSHPSDVAVDTNGNVYVTDWGNDRVQVFDGQLNHVETWFGDSTLSPWAAQRLQEFPAFAAQREAAGVYADERRFRRPAGIVATTDGRVLVVDSSRHRIQVYARHDVVSITG